MRGFASITTIAYRDGVVAADSQETWDSEAGGASKHKCVKLFRKQTQTFGEVILATAGATMPGMVFVDWYGSGEPVPDHLRMHAIEDADFDVLILKSDGVFIVDRFCRPVKIEDRFIAVGSGRKAALAAMHCGKSAIQAVEIAAKIDPYTSGKIQSMRLVPVVRRAPRVRKVIGGVSSATHGAPDT